MLALSKPLITLVVVVTILVLRHLIINFFSSH